MNVITLLLPVVTDRFEETVNFYKTLTGQDVTFSDAHSGYYLSTVNPFVIIGADTPEALEIPGRVDTICVVDDVEAFWEVVYPLSKEVLVNIETVKAGKHFIIHQQDGKVIEYLQMHS